MKDIKSVRWLNESPLWHTVAVPVVKSYIANERRGWTDVHDEWLTEHFHGKTTNTINLIVPYKGRDNQAIYEIQPKGNFKRFWFKDPQMAVLFKLTFG